MKPRRKVVYDRAGGLCEYCGVRTLPGAEDHHPRKATIDHLVPKSAGGSNELPNLVLACRACNQAKGSHNPFENDPEMMELLTR